MSTFEGSTFEGYRPLLPKEALPHPITIQNMSFDQQKKLWDYPFKGKISKKPKEKPKKANQKKRVIKNRQGKEGNRGGSFRDTECVDKLASYTNVGLALAPTVIKQVKKFPATRRGLGTRRYFITPFQANSILASDRTVIRKKTKKDDFFEHQSILQQFLAASPCFGNSALCRSCNRAVPMIIFPCLCENVTFTF